MKDILQGLLILALEMAIYFALCSIGIPPLMLPFVNHFISWIIWDPKLFFLSLHVFGVSLVAAGTSMYQRDWQGLKQLIMAQLTVAGITEILKRVVGKLRPDGSDFRSFPSGHTSAAFTGASYIHQRHGFVKAIPAYVAASTVGCVRIYKSRHDMFDVFGGATIGILTAYSMVTRKPDPNEEQQAALQPDIPILETSPRI